MICSNCGYSNNVEEANFCKKCGAKLPKNMPQGVVPKEQTKNSYLIKRHRVSLAIILGFIVGFGVCYGLMVEVPKIKAAKVQASQAQMESNLRGNFQKFSNMITVGLCQQAYDQYTIPDPIPTKGYDDFLAYCKNRENNWSNINIETVVFSGNNRADVKSSYNFSEPDLDSQDYKNCLNGTILNTFDFCSSIAPTKIVKNTLLETWLLQNGTWRQDY